MDITQQDKEKIFSKFVSDPDWVLVERLLLTYIQPLRDSGSIDVSQSAEHVKCEVMARQKQIDGVEKFLAQTKIIQNIGQRPKTNPFK